MSLVGPRPWPPSMVAEQVVEGSTYRERDHRRLDRPGSVRERHRRAAGYRELDCEYVDACRTMSRQFVSSATTSRLLWRTVDVMLRKARACATSPFRALPLPGLVGDPDLLARPMLRPGGDDLEVRLRGRARLNLDEVVDREARRPQQSDPVSVREVDSTLPSARTRRGTSRSSSEPGDRRPGPRRSACACRAGARCS